MAYFSFIFQAFGLKITVHKNDSPSKYYQIHRTILAEYETKE